MPKLSDFKITIKSVRDLPDDRDAVYFDSELKGFGVRVKAKGKASYILQYRNKDAVSRRYTIGQIGGLTPDEARKSAKKLIGQITDGADPAKTKKDSLSAQTVKQLCDAYSEAVRLGLADPKKAVIFGKNGPKKASTFQEDLSRINRHIIPLLGNRKVCDLKTADISRFMRDIAVGKTALDLKTKVRGRARVTGGAGIASRTVGLLGGILTYAVSEGLIDNNPCRGVKRPEDKRRHVRLSNEDYAALGAAFRASEQAGEPWQTVAAFRLLALTGCRLGEVAKLKWADVDLSGAALRLSDSKTGRSVRPLGQAAVALLFGLDRNGIYVFPAMRLSDAPYGGFPKAWTRILSRAVMAPDSALNGLTPHGLRHGFASVAGDLGMSEITIAALLGHAAASVTGRYIHALDTTLIAAADRVAARIWSYMEGTDDTASIVPLRRA
jgi:integrase